MNKVLVNVYVPVLDTAYDIFIPPQSKLHEVLELVKKAVSELSDGRFIPEGSTVLCRRSDGMIFNINRSVFELEIQNGSRLMLI